MKTAALTLAFAVLASVALPSIAEAACGATSRSSSAECSYQRQSESAQRAYSTGKR